MSCFLFAPGAAEARRTAGVGVASASDFAGSAVGLGEGLTEFDPWGLDRLVALFFLVGCVG